MYQQLPRRVFQDQMRRQNKTSPCTLQEWATALWRARCWSRGDGESPGWVLQLASAAAGVDAEKGACLPSHLWGLLGLMTKICWWLESEGHSSLLLCKAGSCELPGHRISRPSVFCRLRCLEQNNTSASCQLVFFL